MTQVYFAAGRAAWAEYGPHLAMAFAAAGLQVALSDTCDDPAAVDYIIYAPSSPLQDFTPFTRCKAVFSLWAGVERIVGNATLTQPLCRMVDPALTMGMVEWVVGHTLRHHLGMDAHIVNAGRVWDNTPPPLASERPVAMLGTGELGMACALALRALGFPVTLWGRTAKPGCLHGADGLHQALAKAQIVVTLLPKTAQTENLLNETRLAILPKGAVILNPGRGALIDDEALLAALNTHHIAHATLDVFRVEPLPYDHPFWAHPGITVTPHIAADTRADSAARVIAENVRRGEKAEPFLHLVDRQRGY
jgi:glyoxylate/hydroxypyruvate reductase